MNLLPTRVFDVLLHGEIAISYLYLMHVIDQAPVSDREYRATLPETASMIDLASKMISEGKGSDLMPREANSDAPITAYR